MNRTTLRTALLLAAALLLPAAARAQAGAPLPEARVGERVRVIYHAEEADGKRARVAGTLAAVEGDSVLVVDDGAGVTVRVPGARVVALQASRGKAPRADLALKVGVGFGAAGALVGGMIGDALGALGDPGQGAAYYGIPAFLGGMVIGALIEPGERWVAAGLPGAGAVPSVAVDGGGGVRVGVSVRL